MIQNNRSGAMFQTIYIFFQKTGRIPYNNCLNLGYTISTTPLASSKTPESPGNKQDVTFIG